MRADPVKPRPPLDPSAATPWRRLDPRFYQIAVLSGLLIYGLGRLRVEPGHVIDLDCVQKHRERFRR